LNELSRTKNNLRITGISAKVTTTYLTTLGINRKDYLQNLDIEGRMMGNESLKCKSADLWSGLIWLRIGTSGCSCVICKVTSGS
jgi:hypothetical protein